MEVTKQYCTAAELQKIAGLSVRDVRALRGKAPGHWSGNRFKFNVPRIKQMQMNGELDELITESYKELKKCAY